MKVSELRRFPIKSFQTGLVDRVDLGPNGIVGDRTLGFREIGTDRVLSAKAPRIGETLLSFSAEFDAEPVVGEALPTVTLTIGGASFSSADVAAINDAATAALELGVELVTAGGKALNYAWSGPTSAKDSLFPASKSTCPQRWPNGARLRTSSRSTF